MSVTASQITGISTVCTSVCEGYEQIGTKVPHHTHTHTRPVRRNAFPCYDVINKSPVIHFYFECRAQSLQWRHNDHDSVSNHQPHGCLLNRLFRRGSKKTSKLRVTGLCVGNSPGPVNSPHKGPVKRELFPFDDVIMWFSKCSVCLKMKIEEQMSFSTNINNGMSDLWWYITNTDDISSWLIKSPATRLFLQQSVYACSKGNIDTPHYSLFVKGIHRWAVVSYKGSVMRSAFSCNDVISLKPNRFPKWFQLVRELYAFQRKITVSDDRKPRELMLISHTKRLTWHYCTIWGI